LIAIFILWFSGNTAQTLLFSLIYSATAFAILSPGLVPADVLYAGQAANIPMIVVGKLIQVYSNFNQGHTGQLSAVTVILLTLGSLARVFTSWQETGDQIVILTYVCSSSVNLLLTSQLFWYWNVDINKKRD